MKLMDDPSATSEEMGAALRTRPSRTGLNSSDRIILEALHHFSIDGRKAKVSMRKLSTHVGRSVSSVGKSLRRLEACGVITISKGPQLHVASTYTMTEEVERGDTGRQFVMEGLPDCFRTRDLVGPGWMHTIAPKGVPLSVSAIAAFSSTKTRPTITKYLRVLAGLPVPLVTSEQDPTDLRRKLHTFHVLTPEVEREILDDLALRLPGWRPTPRAQFEDLYRTQTTQRLRELGVPTYADLAPHVLANVLVSAETDCWLSQGARNQDGYAIAHPELPNVGAHRIVYRHLVGEITNGSEVHHFLDDCSRHCVNPAHLVVVSMPFHRVVTSQASARRRAGQT